MLGAWLSTVAADLEDLQCLAHAEARKEEGAGAVCPRLQHPTWALTGFVSSRGEHCAAGFCSVDDGCDVSSRKKRRARTIGGCCDEGLDGLGIQKYVRVVVFSLLFAISAMDTVSVIRVLRTSTRTWATYWSSWCSRSGDGHQGGRPAAGLRASTRSRYGRVGRPLEPCAMSRRRLDAIVNSRDGRHVC